MIGLWLNGRPRHTIRAYEADVRTFLAHAGRPLRAVTIGDVQAYGASLAELSSASQSRRLSSVKSLLAFAHRVGYVAFDVGAPVKLPPVKATLGGRIMDEAAVRRMLTLEQDPRNHVLLRLLYLGGLRISEICGLTWRDLVARDDAGQVTVFGKVAKPASYFCSPASGAS